MQDPPERLRNAIINGNLAITKRLLSKFPELWLNIDPNSQGWCNLHYASFYGNYLVCFHLVSLMRKLYNSHNSEHSIYNIDLLTFDNLTVLHMPLVNHHSQTLHFLLQEFSSDYWINFRGGNLLRTPLHYCCVHCFADGLKLLLEFGADWKVCDSNGDSCLHLCFAYGDADCLRELIKFVARWRVKQYLASRTEQEVLPTKTVGSRKGSELMYSSSTHFQYSSNPRDEDIKHLVLKEINAYEIRRNNKGWKAIEYTATFDLASRYSSLKEKWIDQAIHEEMSYNDPSAWGVTLSLFAFDQTNAPSSKGSMHSSTSSSFANDGHSLSNSNLVGGEAGILFSQINPVHPMAYNVNDSDDSLHRFPDGNKEVRVGRQHLRSLPGAVASEIAIEKVQLNRVRSNTGVPINSRPSLQSLRTPSLTQGAMIAPKTPNLNEISAVASLKSITISPQHRSLKTRIQSDVTEGNEKIKSPDKTITEEKIFSKSSFGDSGVQSPLLTTFKSIKPVTPTSTKTNFSTTPPVKRERRWSVSSLSSAKPHDTSTVSLIARTAADFAVRSRGLLLKLMPTTSPQAPASKRENLKRNVSNPSVASAYSQNTDYIGSLSRKPSKRALQTFRRPLPPFSRFNTLSLQEPDSPRSVPTEELSSSENPITPLHIFSQPELIGCHIPSASTPRKVVKEVKDEETSRVELPRNLSSISFTRIRDE